MTQHDSGMLRIPSPHDANSGFHAPGYAIGSAPPPAPEGQVFVPGLNTYVDYDIAAQLGLTATQGALATPQGHALSLQPEGTPSDQLDMLDNDVGEMSDAELEALQDEVEMRSQREPSLSPTLDDIAACFGKDFNAAVNLMVNGSAEETIGALSEATGLDAHTAASLIETTVLEAEPLAAEHIGGDRWASLVYAAAATPDPFAKRVVADFVQGKLHPSKLMSAYTMWWKNLPSEEA